MNEGQTDVELTNQVQEQFVMPEAEVQSEEMVIEQPVAAEPQQSRAGQEQVAEMVLSNAVSIVSKFMADGQYQLAHENARKVVRPSDMSKDACVLRTFSAIALLSMGKLREANAELSCLGSLDQIPTAPFILRFLQASSPLMLDVKAGPERLYDLYWFCEHQRRAEPDASNSAMQAEWDSREVLILNAIAARHCTLRQINLAALVLERLVAIRPHDPAVLSDLGRTYYALGCPVEAKALFDEAEKYMDMEHNADHCTLNGVNRSLLLMGDDRFSDAADFLRESQQKLIQVTGGAASSSITNNIGVCAMSQGLLSRSLELFRETVASRPTAVSDSTRSNMFILFDLISDRSAELKQRLQAQISKNQPQSA